MRRILVLSTRDIRSKNSGGASLYIYEILRRLSNKYEITICSGIEDELPRRERLCGMNIVRLPFRGFSRVAVPIAVLTNLFGPTDLIIDNGDVAFPWLTPLYSHTPTLTIIYQSVREIFSRELIRPISDMATIAEPWIYKMYKRKKIVTCSQSTKTDLVEFGLRADDITVVKPGIRDSFLSSKSTPKFENPTVVCVSRFQKYKGIDYLIRAMKFVLQEVPSAELIIAGSGDETNIERQLSGTDYSPSVKVINRRSNQWDDEKRELFAKAHLSVVPSIREGYGIVVIEANACGTPVIGWNVPGLRDSILDGKTGVLVPFGDVEKLGKQIALYLKDFTAREKMSTAAVEWAREHSWDRSSSEFDRIIDSLAAK